MSENRQPALEASDDELLPEDELELEADEEIDEPETDEPEPDEPGEIEVELPRGRARPGRIERANARARAAEERSAALERRLAELERRPAQQFDPMAAERAHQAELERISMLPPEQQLPAALQYGERRTVAAMQAMESRTQDTLDRQHFSALQERNPTARRLASRVEEVRRENPTVSREVILKYLVGEEVMAKAASVTTRQRRQGRANVRRETVRGSSSRSTEGRPNGRDDNAAYRKRLESYTF